MSLDWYQFWLNTLALGMSAWQNLCQGFSVKRSLVHIELSCTPTALAMLTGPFSSLAGSSGPLPSLFKPRLILMLG